VEKASDGSPVATAAAATDEISLLRNEVSEMKSAIGGMQQNWKHSVENAVEHALAEKGASHEGNNRDSEIVFVQNALAEKESSYEGIILLIRR
jgi:hypothetical protein